MRGEERGKQDVSSALDVGAGLQLFLIAVQYFPNEALEKELRGPGIPVAQNGIHPVGGEVPLPGVQPHDGFPLTAGFLLAEGHHLFGPALPGGVPGGGQHGPGQGQLGVPEGGDGGGTVVVTGTPETVAACEQSYTGQYLKKMLER